MYLIVGLGNPGQQYAHTRHNAGFDALEVLARRLNVSICRKKDDALIGECFIAGQKTLLVMPQTYMNLSGHAVSALLHYFRIPMENLLVIYDDIDLPPGHIRIRKNGSAGTHNGMRSIVEQLGSDQFPRIRIGVGDRPAGADLAAWVLGHSADPEERQLMDEAFQQAALAVECFVREGVEAAMRTYNTKKQKKPKEQTKERDAGDSVPSQGVGQSPATPASADGTRCAADGATPDQTQNEGANS
ncbi:MAG: aminoacyl-tRNA hydrolase [Clostridiales bacterium]|nr:aminoacyl-tRNA hydrolase [Clostridiales bacterium]